MTTEKKSLCQIFKEHKISPIIFMDFYIKFMDKIAAAFNCPCTNSCLFKVPSDTRDCLRCEGTHKFKNIFRKVSETIEKEIFANYVEEYNVVFKGKYHDT